MFVQWKCGCIGLKLKDTCIVIDDCFNRISLMFKLRPEKNKDEFVELDERQVKEMSDRIDTLLLDGFKWRTFLKTQNMD